MPMAKGRFGPLVGAIDEGTSSARFIVFSPRSSAVVTQAQFDLPQIYPQVGTLFHIIPTSAGSIFLVMSDGGGREKHR